MGLIQLNWAQDIGCFGQTTPSFAGPDFIYNVGRAFVEPEVAGTQF